VIAWEGAGRRRGEGGEVRGRRGREVVCSLSASVRVFSTGLRIGVMEYGDFTFFAFWGFLCVFFFCLFSFDFPGCHWAGRRGERDRTHRFHTTFYETGFLAALTRTNKLKKTRASYSSHSRSNSLLPTPVKYMHAYPEKTKAAYAHTEAITASWRAALRARR